MYFVLTLIPYMFQIHDSSHRDESLWRTELLIVYVIMGDFLSALLLCCARAEGDMEHSIINARARRRSGVQSNCMDTKEPY